MPSLGNEFAASVCGQYPIKPLQAKLILYSALDDGYGRYFHDIFDEEDRNYPYLVRDVGAPRPAWSGSACETCAASAQEFIRSKGLVMGEWRDTWQDIALSGTVSRKLNAYQSGELGQRFLQQYHITGSSIDLMVAKRALMDFVACNGCIEKIFTEEERASTLFSAIIETDGWRNYKLCSDKFLSKVEISASWFASLELDMFRGGAPFVGVTFGWLSKNQSEWHAFGDLISVNAFRGELGALPGLFGTACFNTSFGNLPQMYENTWLCVVAADTHRRIIPDLIDNTYVYSLPIRDIVSCKWVGPLPEVLGAFCDVSKSIKTNYLQTKKELENNA